MSLARPSSPRVVSTACQLSSALPSSYTSRRAASPRDAFSILCGRAGGFTADFAGDIVMSWGSPCMQAVRNGVKVVCRHGRATIESMVGMAVSGLMTFC